MGLTFTFFLMIFAHIVDDFYLQGILAKMKQKQWWQENGAAELYKHDYIVALIIHGLSWAFMIMLPIAMYYDFRVNFIPFAITLLVNALMHAFCDHAKANLHTINLIQDQMYHLLQIVTTFLICIFSLNMHSVF